MEITETLNEAKDNVKYLNSTLKFLVPLYEYANTTGESQTVILMDIIPALVNALRMIHASSRYFNTTQRMTNLFSRTTSQMIHHSKMILAGGQSNDTIWDQEPTVFMEKLLLCVKLRDRFVQEYGQNKE